jgi:hypothetical protein
MCRFRGVAVVVVVVVLTEEGRPRQCSRDVTVLGIAFLDL